MRAIIMHVLDQRMSVTMIEEGATYFLRGSYAVKMSTTHLIQRRRKWRMRLQNSEEEGIPLGSHWDYK